MTARTDLISTHEAAALLGVTVQQVRRLIEAGEIDRVARGLLDRGSVERYAQPDTAAALRVVPGSLGDRAEVVGAVSLAIARVAV